MPGRKIRRHPATDMPEAHAILRSIPVVGPVTAAALPVWMPEPGTVGNRQAAALAGVAPPLTSEPGLIAFAVSGPRLGHRGPGVPTRGLKACATDAPMAFEDARWSTSLPALACCPRMMPLPTSPAIRFVHGSPSDWPNSRAVRRPRWMERNRRLAPFCLVSYQSRWHRVARCPVFEPVSATPCPPMR